jgi:4a-hydroxytetrahydrobiopterin dehydratase
MTDTFKAEDDSKKQSVPLEKVKCVPCQIGAEPLNDEAIEKLLGRLAGGWRVIDRRYLEKEYKFKNFRLALEFVNKVGELAESESHHPDIYLAWGRVRLKIWTHKINGLHNNDFILAAKIDALQ